MIVGGVPMLFGGAAGDPYFANVVSLLHFDGNLTDVTGKAWTAAGASVQPVKFGSAALHLDGGGDWITATDHADLELGSSNFTIEMWVSTTSSGQYDTLISRTPSSFVSGAWTLLINHDSATDGRIAVYLANYSTGAPMLKSGVTNIRDGNYHHVAWVRDGTNHAIYLDGTCVASITGVSFTVADLAAGPRIGADQSYVRDIPASIDEFRFTKGVARYIGTTVGVSYFTPSTMAFPDDVGGDPDFASVVSLLHFNGNFTDVIGKTWTAAGNATTTATKLYGSSSLAVPGGSNQISTPDHVDWYIGGAGESFTIESWVYLTQVNAGNYRYFVSQVATSQRQFGVGLHESSGIRFYYTTDGATDLFLDFATTFSLNTWYHIAVSKSGNTVRVFKDGVKVGADGTLSSALFNSNAAVSIGTFGNFNLAYLNWAGYIDDVRITKGVARYTADFTPPTAAFPDA